MNFENTLNFSSCRDVDIRKSGDALVVNPAF